MLGLHVALRRRWGGRSGAIRTTERLNGTHLFQIPRLANTETAVIVLPRLLHSHSSRTSHRNDDEPRLLIAFHAVRRRRGGRIYGILCDPDVGDVTLGELAVGVEFAEAGGDEAALLILEALSAGHGGGGGGGDGARGLGRCVEVLLGRLRLREGGGHGLRGGSEAHVAIAIARHVRKAPGGRAAVRWNIVMTSAGDVVESCSTLSARVTIGRVGLVEG